MSQKSIVTLVDDLTGEEAAETISFALDGKSYEIDLTAEHATKMREALSPYTDKARTAGGRARRKSTKSTATKATSSASSTDSQTDSQAVRAWAKEQGLPVADRGRIPSSVISEFNAAQSN